MRYSSKFVEVRDSGCVRVIIPSRRFDLLGDPVVDLTPAHPVITIGGRPRSFRLERSGDRLRICYRQRSPELIGIAILSSAAAGVAAGSAIADPSLAVLLVAAVVLPPSLVALTLSIVSFINTTIIEVDSRLRTHRTPIHWPRATELRADQILQLEVLIRPIAARWGSVARVWALTDDGGRFRVGGLLFGEHAADGAAFIERQVERHLGIKDRAVICPQCGYDVRASKRRCSECGCRLRKPRRRYRNA